MHFCGYLLNRPLQTEELWGPLAATLAPQLCGQHSQKNTPAGRAAVTSGPLQLFSLQFKKKIIAVRQSFMQGSRGLSDSLSGV